MLSGLACKLALICAFPVSLLGQSTADVIQTHLIGKPLYLRGLWKEDKLHFDSAGKLQGSSKTLSFTLCGIEVTKVDLQPKRLLLEGRRVGLVFDKSVPQRIVLLADSRDSHDEQMQIEIDAPSGGDYNSALDAIFTDDLADFVPSLLPEWQDYATKHLLHDSPPPTAANEQPPSPPGVFHVGGGVAPPRPLKEVGPKGNEYARATKIKGMSTIFVVIDQKGRPTQLSIVRPLGAGLDEEALAAIQQYVFEPAVMGGKPVPVGIDIEVGFTAF
jgi:TonB family protein